MSLRIREGNKFHSKAEANKFRAPRAIQLNWRRGITAIPAPQSLMKQFAVAIKISIYYLYSRIKNNVNQLVKRQKNKNILCLDYIQSLHFALFQSFIVNFCASQGPDNDLYHHITMCKQGLIHKQQQLYKRKPRKAIKRLNLKRSMSRKLMFDQNINETVKIQRGQRSKC